MAKKIGFPGMIILVLVLVTVACQKPMAPEYIAFENLRVNKMSAQGSRISANLQFYNPNQFSVQLKRAEMDISMNDKLVDHYLLDSAIFIPAKDTFYIPVAINVDIQHLFTNALQALLTKEVKITLNGKVKLKRGLLTFSRPFIYEVNQPLNSFLQAEN